MARWKSPQQLADVLVDSPYGRAHGMDQVQRVIDPIESMKKRLDESQMNAAKRYQWAYEACPGPIRCALDVSGRGGGGNGSHGPSASMALAVEYLIDAHRWLGDLDGYVVRLVCGEGRTLKQTASVVFADKFNLRDLDVLGRRLSEGLTTLGNHWFALPKERIRGERMSPRSEVQIGAIQEQATKGAVAHATSNRIYGFEPEGGQPRQSELKRITRNRRMGQLG